MSEEQLRRQLALADDLRERLYEYAVDDEPGRFSQARHDAWQLFFGPLVPAGQLPEDHLDWDAYDDWFLFDYRLSDGLTPIEHFRLMEAGKVSTDEREMLERWGSDRFGVFVVDKLIEGSGARLRDCSDGTLYLVPNVRLNRHGARWDVLVGRLVPVGEGHGFTTTPRYLIPALLDRLPGDFVGREPPAGDRRARNIELWWVIRRLAAEQPAVPVTDEGDPVRPSVALYRHGDQASLVASLEKLPFLKRVQEPEHGEVWFEWTGVPQGGKPGEKLSLGVVRILPDALYIECLSPERLRRGRPLIEPTISGIATHEEDRISDPPDSAPLSAEDSARSRSAGQALGEVLMAVSRDQRLAALSGAATGSELAAMLEHFASEPVALLAGLHHQGAVAVDRVLLKGDIAGVEIVIERKDGPPVHASARLRETPSGWRVEKIRPGRLDQQPSEAVGDDPVLIALWTGSWQWAPNGSAADHSVLGRALKRLHLAGRPFLDQTAAIRLWQDFTARASPDSGVDEEDWAFALCDLMDWLSGRSGKPAGSASLRIAAILGLTADDPRYSGDRPILADLTEAH